MEQRAVKLAELDRRIVQLEGQEAELIETAAGAGIALA
jgi:hypothetical protein